MYEFFTQPGSKSAMSDQGEAAAHVRCTPMATELVRHGNPPLRAKSRPSVGGQGGGRPRHGIQVNVYLSWRISSKNLGSQLALLRRVLTLPLRLLARTRPRAKRRTMAMFLAPCPVR